MKNIKNFLNTYLNDLRFIHGSGKATDERSYYPALASLFNAVGATLTPRLVALHDVADHGGRGLGHPDFLIQKELQKETTQDTGIAVEAKGAARDIESIIDSEQARRYLTHHDPTLVTNLRDFALVRQGRNKQPEVIMAYSLAPDEATFWHSAAGTLTNEHAERFGDFLLTSLTWDAEIKRPGELAGALARYARETLRRLELQPAEAIDPLRTALSEALGLQFTGAEGEHFFRSSLVQTLFYGLFSAWVACNRQGNCDNFYWKDAGDYLGLPLVRELFEKIAIASQLETFDIRKPVEWAEATLKRTIWEPFAEAFDKGDAINYFYEPFLEAFDPQLRRDLGVWYTPPEIVRYMVARVDMVLREELGVEDGLASPNVVILDPCCGTGAYLLETLRHIAATLKDKGGDALLAADLKQAAVNRVFGFEIMPSPYIVAQLQIGTLLTDLGAPLKKKEHAGVYLTNALTGWQERYKQLALDGFPALKHEAEASASVKQETPILVILGNPPYSGFAGTAVAEERDLTNAYRTTRRATAPQGQGLNDLYVRFYRMAERRIVEKTGKGVICFISNYSWLDGLSFTGMRERYLDCFDRIWIDNLHGDRIISEYAPDGRTSETIFAIQGSSVGIKIGTAISLMVAKDTPYKADSCELRYRDMDQARADERRASLVESLNAPNYQESYISLKPLVELGYPFKPRAVGIDYLSWPRLSELFPASFSGIQTSRDDVVVDIDREALKVRMQQYFDPTISHEQMQLIASGAMEDGAGFNAKAARDELRKRGFLAQNIVRYCYRPFDNRWLYWESETNLLNRIRGEYFPHVFEGNVWLTAGQRHRKEKFYQPQFTSVLADHHIVESNVGLFPLYLRHGTLLEKTVNLSGAAGGYLERLNSSSIQSERGYLGAEALFYHAIAIMHAPAYRVENAGALRQDWPRIPLSGSAEALAESAELGQQIAALLDTEHPVKEVTEGKIRDDLKVIGGIARVGGGQLNPGTDLAVTAGWGHGGKGGVTMPGKGKLIERDYAGDEAKVEALGPKTCDVYLNDKAYWKNIPIRVWEYTIGGYQVIKKWLSYREQALLGRSLTSAEVREVTNMARRIAAILLLEEALDANYQAVKANAVNLVD